MNHSYVLLGQSPKTEKKLIVGVAVGAIVLIIVIILILAMLKTWCLVLKTKNKPIDLNEEKLTSSNYHLKSTSPRNTSQVSTDNRVSSYKKW